MTKNELRKKYKALRSELSHKQIDELSINIANQILKMDIWNYDYYHIFLPITTQKEINTEFILHILQGKDKHVVISKSNFSDGSLNHFLLTDQTKLLSNKYGIPEPIDGIEIADNKIEIVFVPLLAFDNTGARLGYGKGFYDRFLAKAKPKKIIGLSFFEAEQTGINTNSFDISLHYCALPDKIVSFI